MFLSHVSAVIVSVVILQHVSAVIVLSGCCQQCFCHMSVLLLCCQGGLSSVFVTSVLLLCCQGGLSSVLSHVSAVIVSVVILQHVSAVIVSVVSFHHVSAVIVLSGWSNQCFCHMSVLLLCQ